MKKFYNLIITLIATATVTAAPLTPGEALKRVRGNGPMHKTAIADSQFKLSYTQKTEQGSPAVYIFNAADNGYLVVSADDNATPLLGYADKGNFNIAQMPPQMKWWLGEYAAQIASAKQTAAVRNASAQKHAVSPLLPTRWNQGTPFNNLCPNKYPTGCVATAMAQVMKKWNYPQVATQITDLNTIGAQPHDYTLEWGKMLDTYTLGNYNSEQANAVATLMLACGYAVDMDYAEGGSGANPLKAAIALSKNFKYNSGIQYLDRYYSTSSEWEDLIYKELAAGRPVIYGGQSTSVGHEFVCDGYDGSGYYHFNWGWGGMSDGYFLLDALNPGAVGTGGGAGGGYNSNQSIIIGVQPTLLEMEPRVTQWGSLSGTCPGSVLSLTAKNEDGKMGSWLNMDITPISVRLGVEISSTTNPNFTPVYIDLFSQELAMSGCSPEGNQVQYSGINANRAVFLPSNIPDGKYKVTVCSRNAKNNNSEWIPVRTAQGSYNFIYITKSGSKYTVTSMPEATLTITSASTTTPVYYKNSCRIKLSVANNSEIDITGGFYPVLLDDQNKIVFEAEGITMSLAPGETRNEEFTTLFELAEKATAPTVDTNYKLAFLTTAGGNSIYNWSTPVTMYVNSGDPNIIVNNLHVKGATTKSMNVNGTLQTVYVTPDASKIPFEAEIINKGTFFGQDVILALFNSSLGTSVATYDMGPTAILASGEKATVNSDADFSSASNNTVYAAAVFYFVNNQAKQACAPIFFMIDPSTGVNDMEADTESVAYDRATRTVTATEAVSVKLYDLNGSKLAETTGSGTLTLTADGAPGSVAIAVVRTISGKTITRKILM